MRFLSIGFLLCGLLFTACPAPGNTGGRQVGSDSLGCEDLDRLMWQLDRVDSMLANGSAWPECKQRLTEVMGTMERNVRSGQETCHYLNQQNYPEHPRFLFVESLSQRIRADTLPDGVYYFVRLRGIFSDDAAISEYFSEELAHLALANPVCYLGYLRSNPDQEVMLLYSTKWNYLDADTLIHRFARLDGAETVVDYLEEWKHKQNAGGI